MRQRSNWGWSAILLLSLNGCSGEMPSVNMQDIKEAVNEKVEQVQQAAAPLTTGMELELGGPTTTSECYAALMTVSPKHPPVLQVTSYASPEAETFPSVFLRCEAPAGQPGSLVGQKIRAQAYVQLARDGAVWHAPADQPVEVSITAATAESITGEITAGQVVNSQDNSRLDLRGTFTGKLQGE